MSQFKKIGGRYGFHSGSGRVKNFQVDKNLWVSGNPLFHVSGDVWYVDKNKASGVSGDGSTWSDAFMTVTEAVAAAGDYDVIFIGHGTYTEADIIDITQNGLRIFGAGTGTYQWGKTSLNTNTAGGHLLSINANDVEIAGMGFIIETNDKNAIQVADTAEAPWRCHIHDCHFAGNPGEIGINCDITNDPVELVVERCEFLDFPTCGIHLSSSRSKIMDNLFFVFTGQIGLDIHDSGEDRAWKLISDNMFVGTGTCTGIRMETATTAGSIGIFRNLFSNFSTEMTSNVKEVGCINYMDDAAGGALVVPGT